MIIKQQIELELERIQIEENPMNERGKFACFQFRMNRPSPHYFFKKPEKVGDDDFSVVWGTSPVITFYTKNFKDWRNAVLDKIKADLPDGIGMQHLQNWHLAISNYDKTYGNRPWAIFYHVRTYADNTRMHKIGDRAIPVDREFIESITSKPPKHEGKIYDAD